MPRSKVLTLCMAWLLSFIVVFAQQTESPELTSLREKAELGDPAAQLALSDCYSLGKLGAERNITKSMHWIERAATGPDLKIQRTDEVDETVHGLGVLNLVREVARVFKAV